MLYAAIVFLPIIGSATVGLFGPLIGARPSEIVTTGLLIISALFSCYAFYDVAYLGHSTTVDLVPWITSGMFDADWMLRVDSLTAVMLVVVTGVSSLVQYSS